MLQRLQDIGGKKSMNRIYKAFENKKAFIGFLTAGDPVIDKTVDYILDMEEAGASLIEIGIPFSDPIAEGPTIQEANVRALKNKVTTDDVFEMVKKVREKSDIPLCFMTYLMLFSITVMMNSLKNVKKLALMVLFFQIYLMKKAKKSKMFVIIMMLL